MKDLNAIIYPFKTEHIPLLRAKSLSDYIEIFPVALDGFQYNQSDAGTLDKGSKLNIEVSTDFLNRLNDADDIIVTEVDEYILGNLKTAISSGKNIVCLDKFSNYDQNLKELCAAAKVKYSIVSCKETIELSNQNIDLALFDVPIIFVCGMSHTTQKFDVFLDIHKRLMERGYRVSSVAARSYAAVLSIHNFPEFLFQKNYEYDKIVYFNNFIKALELTEHPDIILIELPGGIVPYDIKHNNQYGVLPYLVSQAINSVDYAVFSMAYNTYDESFYDFISVYAEYRYGFSIDAFHMSNCFHDLEVDGNEDVILMDKEKVASKIEEAIKLKPDIKMYNVFQHPEMVVDDIISKLGD